MLYCYSDGFKAYWIGDLDVDSITAGILAHFYLKPYLLIEIYYLSNGFWSDSNYID